MKTIRIFTTILLLFTFVGCNEEPEINGGAIPSSVSILPDCSSIELDTGWSFVAEKGYNIEYLEVYCIGSEATQQSTQLTQAMEAELCNLYPMSHHIHAVNQCVEEVTIYADKVIYGTAEGEKLNNHFTIGTGNVYDFRASYPDGKINFEPDLKSHQPLMMDEILCKEYMLPVEFSLNFNCLLYTSPSPRD